MAFALIVVWLFAVGIAAAEDNTIEIEKKSTLIIKHGGTFIIEADSSQNGIRYIIEGKDRKGNAVTGHAIEVKPYNDGYLFVMKKKAGSPGIVGNAKVTLYVNPALSIRLPNVEGNYSITGLSGHIEARLAAGNLTLERCRGQAAIKMSKGNITVKEHMSTVYPFLLDAKKGNVSIEIGKVKKSAPGKVTMKEGRITWKLKEPTALKFYGEVKEGLVTCNLPIQNQEKNLVQFVSLDGKNLWTVSLKKGMLRVELPEPKNNTESMWGY